MAYVSVYLKVKVKPEETILNLDILQADGGVDVVFPVVTYRKSSLR